MSTPVAWVVMLTVSGDSYIMTTDTAIHGFETLQRGLRYFEDKYQNPRNYERSMSVIIHSITFNPIIVPVDSEDELRSWIDSDDEGLATNVSFHSVAGSMTGVKVKSEHVDRLNGLATAPSLVAE